MSCYRTTSFPSVFFIQTFQVNRRYRLYTAMTYFYKSVHSGLKFINVLNFEFWRNHIEYVIIEFGRLWLIGAHAFPSGDRYFDPLKTFILIQLQTRKITHIVQLNQSDLFAKVITYSIIKGTSWCWLSKNVLTKNIRNFELRLTLFK